MHPIGPMVVPAQAEAKERKAKKEKEKAKRAKQERKVGSPAGGTITLRRRGERRILPRRGTRPSDGGG